ncbi:MAG: polysaccharide pyruvyl transferase family protein [Pseudoxanthomonas sp.]
MLSWFEERLIVRARQGAVARRSRGVAGLNAAIIPPAMPGSVGDAAMVSATAQQLRGMGFARVDLFHGSDWPLDARIDRRLPAERYFYGASRFRLSRLLPALADYSHLFMLGADVIDGAYNPGSVNRRLEVLREAAQMGCICTILGSSYNNAPEASTRASLRALPAQVAICGRDPNSHARFTSHLERPIELTADVAFLLDAQPGHVDAMAAIAWIQQRRDDGHRVVAVNANYLHAAKVPGLREGLAKLLGMLLEQPISLLLLSHDSRTREPDEKVLADAVAQLPAALQANTRMLATPSPGAVKAVLAQVDLLVTGRMHAMILALGGHTPSLGFAYQDKFEGLMQLLGLDGQAMLSTPDTLATAPEAVAAQAQALLSQRDTLRQHIAQAMPAALQLAAHNFSRERLNLVPSTLDAA